MSIQLLNKVFDLQLRPAEKLTLTVLADLANDAGICWPSLAYVAPKASVSIRTLQRIINSLEAQGLIKRRPQYRSDGSRRSSEFLILPMNGGGDEMSLPAVQSDTPPASVVTIRHDTTDAPLPHIEPILENHHNIPALLIYPKSFDQARIKTANSLLAGVSATDAQLLLDETAGRMASGRISSPLSYLRALIKRNALGEFVPELADEICQKRLVKTEPVIVPKPARFLTDEQTRQSLSDIRKAIAKGGQHA